MNYASLFGIFFILILTEDLWAMKRQFASEYVKCSKRIRTENPNDPVTFDELTEENSIKLRQGQFAFQPYEINNAYELFVIRSQKSPLTMEPLCDAQKKRIIIYKNYFDNFKSAEILHDDLEQLFLKYLDNRGEDLHDLELLMLERLLVFDSSDSVFSNLGTKLSKMHTDQRTQFVNLAKRALENVPKGTWIIRPSRIEDSEKTNVFARTISCKNADGIIYHARLLHVVGYGFCLQRQAKMNLNLDTFKVEDHDLECFPSLISLIKFSSKALRFDLAKYYRVPRSGYIENMAHQS